MELELWEEAEAEAVAVASADMDMDILKEEVSLDGRAEEKEEEIVLSIPDTGAWEWRPLSRPHA